MEELKSEIELAENEYNDAERLHEAILKLSTNEVAVNILLLALRESAIHSEILWREIEQRADFIAKYGNDRNLAHEDFLYICSHRKEKNYDS